MKIDAPLVLQSWISVADAAKAIGVNDSTIRRLVRARKIGHARIGAGAGKIVFTRAHLDSYLAAAEVPVRDPAEEVVRPGLDIPAKHFRHKGSRRP